MKPATGWPGVPVRRPEFGEAVLPEIPVKPTRCRHLIRVPMPKGGERMHLCPRYVTHRVTAWIAPGWLSEDDERREKLAHSTYTDSCQDHLAEKVERWTEDDRTLSIRCDLLPVQLDIVAELEEQRFERSRRRQERRKRARG